VTDLDPGALPARRSAAPIPVRPVRVARLTILVLTASTGAGHDSTAAALSDALGATLPRARVLVRDPLGARAATRSYHQPTADDRAARAPRLWGWLYHLSNNRRGVWLGALIVAVLYGRRLRATIRTMRPDLIISVHPLCARLAAQSLWGARRRTPHHCVVTDLASVHRYWASEDIAVFYAATPEAAAALASHGISLGRIQVTGLPLRRAFTAPPHATAPHGASVLRVVVLDGGRATRALERAVRALLAPGAPLRVTVVCGDNERLRRRLTAMTAGWATVLGRCDDVAGLMRASSVVVTKAGSATLAEAWSQARPALVYRVLPGQEEGNVALLNHHGRGWSVPVVDDLPAAVWRAHARGPGLDEAAWWGGAAGRVATHVVAALARPDAHEPRPGLAPRTTRGYSATARAEIAGAGPALCIKKSRRVVCYDRTHWT